MSKLRYSTSISLDGFTAGPDQSPEHPLGVGGRALHTWMSGETPSAPALAEDELGVGALIMGRNMFGGGPGPWVESRGQAGGDRVRLFDDVGLDRIKLEPAFVVEAPGVTHLKYRVLR